MKGRDVALAIAVLIGLAFIGALGGRQARGEDSFGLLWMVGAAVASVALLARRVRAAQPLASSAWWFAVASLCCVIGALTVVTLAPLAWIGGVIVGAGMAVPILKIPTVRGPEDFR